MVGQDIPLNQGCLTPVKRVVDVIFRAYKVCAASQGCMNNVTFGSEGSAYYDMGGRESRGGARLDSHMTNTLITDPEILEKRYPMVLEHFSLQPGSGAAGEYRGGDMVIRKLLFRNKGVLSVLTEALQLTLWSPWICFACIPLVEVDMVREDKQAAGYGRPLKNENFSERGSVFEYRMAQGCRGKRPGKIVPQGSPIKSNCICHMRRIQPV
ncbi:hypothetical protein J4Q44_G00297000 [Coregonus suidteri]|uniref:Hydantoinase B/oxoprolinase domain-containing protein n=1 Tax=Coregonus suidteri TaxID=861788 RepID=A0AAN8KY60_9TELE